MKIHHVNISFINIIVFLSILYLGIYFKHKKIVIMFIQHHHYLLMIRKLLFEKWLQLCLVLKENSTIFNFYQYSILKEQNHIIYITVFITKLYWYFIKLLYKNIQYLPKVLDKVKRKLIKWKIIYIIIYVSLWKILLIFYYKIFLK